MSRVPQMLHYVMEDQTLLSEAIVIQIMQVILTRASPPQVMCLLLLEEL